MKLFTALAFFALSTIGIVAQGSCDFTKGKEIDPQAGAWRSDDYRNLKFFFTDGTIFYLSFGETAVGKWKYEDKEKGIVFYDWRSSEGQILGAWTAIIKRDELVEDQGDYTNK